MYQLKVKVLDREITITGSRDTCSTLRERITRPLTVTQCTSSEFGFSLFQLFGPAWSWNERPEALHAEYLAELSAYAASLLPAYTARSIHPDVSWIKKYVPLETELAALRAARKLAT